ncbi:hypothetical protein SAMN05216390_13510 [Lachnospiraceae bacterium KH1T2]|nr:hypothetical protein SAMN05216390_13510 [Lachnospiraceae bacterium KH1T2]
MAKQRKSTVESAVKSSKKSISKAVVKEMEKPETETVTVTVKAVEPEKAVETAPKAETVKKAPAAKKAPVAKKETAPKTVAKKAVIKTTLHVQYADKDITDEDIIKLAKEDWKNVKKNKIGDLKSLEFYVKPEDNTVYYVANGSEEGSFQI